jgi:P pilus assembly chaperone PapD
MLLSVTGRPGSTVVKRLELRSARADANTRITLNATRVGQDEGGGPTQLAPKDLQQNNGKVAARSCFDWFTLSADSVDLAPLETKTVSVTIKIPQKARGYYYAGIAVTQRTPGAGRLAINVEFTLLPLVMVTVQGPPVQQRITLTGAGMKLVPRSATKQASTAVALNIENQGETFVRVRGMVEIYYLTGGAWRRITQADVAERGMFPGVVLSPTADIKRALPAGHYKISGRLYVDNRPSGRIDQEIDYAGDPAVASVATDASLNVKPASVIIEATPGSRRSGTLVVQNPSQEAVQVTCETVAPPELNSATDGQITGASYSCAAWVVQTPQAFAIRGGGSQTVRLGVVYPETAPERANYYANVIIHATYPNGQSAGDSQAQVIVTNPKVEAVPNAAPVKMNLTGQGADAYAVVAQFANTGNTHFDATATASVNPVMGDPVARIKLEAPSKTILPLSSPQFSGVIDFSAVKSGAYSLNAEMAYGGSKSVRQTLPIKVEVRSGRRIVSIMEQIKGKPAPAPAKRPAVKRG